MLGIYLLGNIWSKIEQNNEISRTERRSPVVGKVIGQFDTCFSQKTARVQLYAKDAESEISANTWDCFQHYTVHYWRSRQWTMIAIFLGTEEPKSTISMRVLLVYKIILIVYWNVTTKVWLHAVHCAQSTANHRKKSGVGYPDEFTSCAQCTTATLALYETKPQFCTPEAHQLPLMK